MRIAPAQKGFVLPVVLGLILLAALIVIQSATQLGSATLLSTQRQLHQRAFEAAEGGVAATLQLMGAGGTPAPLQTLRAGEHSAESASVQTSVLQTALRPGFSADRVIESHYEIRSTGHSARASEVTVVQGVSQLQRMAAP